MNDVFNRAPAFASVTIVRIPVCMNECDSTARLGVEEPLEAGGQQRLGTGRQDRHPHEEVSEVRARDDGFGFWVGG